MKQLQRLLRRTQDDVVIFSYSSISWLSGIFTLIFGILNNATRIITTEKFSPKSFGTIVKKYQVTTSIISVELAVAMQASEDFNSSDFQSIKDVLCGGERVPSLTREFMKSHLPRGSFSVAYGSTESGLVSKNDELFDSSKISGNIVGKPNTNAHLKIVDISSRKPLGLNQVGEVLTKSETTFSVSILVFGCLICIIYDF